jgi:hypothetical protein
MLVELGIRGIDEEFVAYLQRAEGIGRFDAEFDLHVFECPCERATKEGTYTDALETPADSNKKAVLIDIVKSVESPEIVALSSTIRFDCVDCVDDVATEAFYFLTSVFFVVFRRVARDRKVDTVSLSPTSAARSDEEQLVG